ncbi:MAG: PadR family transcriptional regulator [Frankiaceae bacterium]
MAARNRSNPLALAVLACLFERPVHPYEVATTLRARAKDESIRLNYGSLYSVVSALEKRRMITPVETEREGRRPERTVYRITDAGRAELVDWLSELLGTPEKEYPGFEAGLSLMPVLPPDDVVRLLENRTTRLRLELEAMRATHDLAAREGLPRLLTIEGEYRRALLEAELQFVRNLRDEIAKGTFEGIKQWRSYVATHYETDPAEPDPERPAPRKSDAQPRPEEPHATPDAPRA